MVPKILVVLRDQIHILHETYFSLADLVVSEEYVLRDGRRIRLNDDGQHKQQVKLTFDEGNLITKREQGGFTLEASQNGVLATVRTLTDDTEYNSVSDKEALVLKWALDQIRALITDAPGIIGADDEEE